MTYLVAELGQNMNGSLAIAREMVDMVARPYDADADDRLPWKWDAVKTTKRDLRYELTRSASAAEYQGRNSFGPTYGEHRKALELSWNEHAEIREHAKAAGLDFVITLCAPSLVEEMPFRPDYVKVASRDLTNGPLLTLLADHDYPIILSTGMHGPEELERALGIVGTERTTVLHCISQYPAQPESLNLRTIEWLREKHPDVRVGFSDHTIGLLAGPMAVALGAEVIEKHVSLARCMRGTDQRGALGPEGCWRYVRNVRQAERMLGERAMYAAPEANAARRKLERSIAATSDLLPGTVLGSSNTCLLSPGTGVPWHARNRIFGKPVMRTVPRHELVTLEDFTVSGSTWPLENGSA